MAHHRLGAAQLAKLGEQMEQPRVHFFIGIEANPAVATIRQPGRQRHPQLASRRLLPLALMRILGAGYKSSTFALAAEYGTAPQSFNRNRPIDGIRDRRADPSIDPTLALRRNTCARTRL